MPIFESRGKQYNIPENKVESFLSSRKDAKLVGQATKQVNNAQSTPRQSNIQKGQGSSTVESTVNQTNKPQNHAFDFQMPVIPDYASQIKDPKLQIGSGRNSFQDAANRAFINHSNNVEPIRGFSEGFEQGTKALVEGSKVAGANIANVATGSSKDAERALGILEKYGVNGSDYNPSKAYRQDIQDKYKSDMERYKSDMDKWYEKHPSILGRAKAMLPFIGDMPEEPKSPNVLTPTIGDIGGVIGDRVDMRPYKLVQEALEHGDLEKAKNFLREKAGQKTWGDEVEANAIRELATLHPTEGFGAWVGNITPQMIPNALAIASTLHPSTRSLAKPLAHGGIGVLSLSSGGSAIAEARQYAEATGMDIPESTILNAGALATAIEIVTEKIPLDRYLGNVGGKLGGKVAKDIVTNPAARSELTSFFTRAVKDIPGLRNFTSKTAKRYLENIAIEGASEFSAEALGAMVPMLYANKEDYPTLTEILENGWEGFKGGIFMGGVLGGGSHFTNNFAQNQRRKQQGSITLMDTGNEIVEFLGQDNGIYTVLNNKGEVVDIPATSVTESHIVGWEEFRDFARDQRKENIENSAFANLEASEKQIIRESFTQAERKFDTAFANTPLVAIKEDILNASPEQQQEFIMDVATMEDFTDEQKTIAIDLIVRGNAYNSYRASLDNVVDNASQDVAEYIEENANPSTNSIMTAKLAGHSEPVQIVDGKIVRNEDGSINEELSDKSITFMDSEGNRKPMSIRFVEEVIEEIGTEDAVNQAVEAVTAPIITQQQNEEVRTYDVGEQVRVQMGDMSLLGVISGIDGNGNYIFTEATTQQELPIEPRQIVNEDNLIGIEPGMEVQYFDANGNIQTGVMNDLYSQRMQGNVFIGNDLVPVSSVIGLVEKVNTEQTNETKVELDYPHYEHQSDNEFESSELSGKHLYSAGEFMLIEQPDMFGNMAYRVTNPSNGYYTKHYNTIEQALYVLEKQSSEKAQEVGKVEYLDNNKTSQNSNIENGQTTQVVEQSDDISPTEQTTVSHLEQIERGNKGELLFEQSPVENTIGALQEIYTNEGELRAVIDATLANIEKSIDKVSSTKPTGDINKDIANKQKANQELSALNEKKDYWNNVLSSLTPTKESITKQLTGEESVSTNEGRTLSEIESENINEDNTISFWHGGLSGDFDLSTLDVFRPARKQQKKNRNYAGFYMYNAENREGAATYAKQENASLHRFDVDANARVLELGNIERVSQKQLQEYRDQGYDLIRGTDVRGRTEYILLNKDVVSNLESESAPKETTIPLENKKEKTVREKKPTKFQKELSALEDYVHTTHDNILYGIASGAYRFRWADKGTSKGLGSELGLLDSESERKARFGLLLNDGFTPATLGEYIRGNSNIEVNDNDVRSEVIDILSSVTSKRKALDALKSSLNLDEDAYYREQAEAHQFEEEQKQQRIDIQNEITDRLNDEDFVSLRNEAIELGISNELLDNTQTVSGIIDLIEQLEYERKGQENGRSISETRTEDSGNSLESEGAETTGDRLGNRESSESRREGRTERETQDSSRRDRADISSEHGESESKRGIQTSDSQNNYSNLTTEEQAVVDTASNKIDAEIAEVESSIRAKQTELQNKRKELGKEYAKENQTDLFSTEKTSDNLFDVDADFSKQNIESIIKPIENELSSLVNKGRDLMNGKDKRISDALRNFRSQGTIFDAIARAEAETDTNPTNAQKEAGNYKKGKVNIQGFDLTIEQPKGSERSGTDENGNAWSVTMQNTYGYIRGTEGKDGDHIDIFLGNNPDSQVVYVVDQVNDEGEFDEHKVMFGFNSLAEARDAYLSNYSQGWQGMGEITGVDVESFRKWTESDSRKIKPFAEYAEIKKQSSITRFAPIEENKFNDLVDRLKQTGLAKDVITDKEAFDKKLSEVIDNDAVAKQMLSEMESIKQESIANNTFMLAPNGEKTNLSETQWLQVRTTNFKNWFGDWVNDPANASKVVDENGEPLVVYHGTPYYKEFYEFKPNHSGYEDENQSVFFGDNKKNVSTYGNRIGSYFLRIITPNETDAKGVSYNDERNETAYLAVLEVVNSDTEVNDGGIIHNIIDVKEPTDKGVESKTFLVFEPTQIKSAISNNGEFSVDNADIRMQVYEGALQDFRDAHTAPSMDYDTLLEANEEGGDVSLSEIITGKQGIVPDDFFDTRIGSFNSGRKGFVGAIRYGYDTKAGNESINAIKALKAKLAKGEDVQKLTARVYRAVPNSVTEDSLVNRDWITLSKEYANNHGLSRFGEGEYKVIEQDVPLNKIWWDGNDINEFGYDTTENTRFMRTSQGEVYGFVTAEGEVYLDSTRMNANTPIHEFGHLWNTFTKENNTELYNRGAELIQESEYWDAVNSNPTYAYLSQEAKIDEAIAMAIGDKGESIVKEQGLKTKLKKWISDVWAWLGDKFNISPAKLQEMTLDQFTDIAVTELLEGKKLSQKNRAKGIDEAYFKAIENNDLQSAQRIIDNLARAKGYISDNDFRMNHTAPNREDHNMATLMEDSIVPSDYWTHPRYYQYESDEFSSFYAVKKAIEKYKEKGKSSIVMYRAVPKDVKEDRFRNGDWITPSKEYARSEGEGIVEGYRLIWARVPIQNVWWDANSINEFGYDDGEKYAYKNTKNNRKLLDPITYDYDDKIIPPSKRFNYREYDTRFQSVNNVNDVAEANNSRMTEEMRIDLDMRLKNKFFKIREAWEDKHLAIKEFLDVLRNNRTEVAEHNDYHLQVTHMSGKNDAQLDHYRNTLQRPLNSAISDIQKAGFEYRDVENYAILKHGLERNKWMREKAIQEYQAEHPDAKPDQLARFIEKLPEDYAGVLAVEEEVKKTAEEFIQEFEGKAGKQLIDNLWSRVKDASQDSLTKQLEGGLLDKKSYDELTSRYKYYIPLRGHDDAVAEDRWDYTPVMGTYFVNPLVKANGRRTRAEKPFAFIAQQAQSSINSSNRNILNQTLLRLANQDKTGLMNVSRSWYELVGEQDGQPLWEQRQAEYSENPETYQRNIEKFEERMAKLQESGFAFQSGKKLDIGGLFIKKKQAEQHEVHIYQNGVDYTVYINANPKVAQAMNGTNVSETPKVVKPIAKMSRFMAANFTTRNPMFVMTNFSRDYLFASSILPVKENAKYAIQFQKNIPSAAGALQRYLRGKADMTQKQDQYLMEYILGGAKTGFSHIVEIQKMQKQLEKDIKKGDKRNALEKTLEVFSAANDFAENLSRLSVYITSREQGRSQVRSVSDAKEVTVNFNRSGSGALGANVIRPMYLFVNAGLQSISNFAKVAVKNPSKTAALMSTYVMTGALLAPMLAQLLGGDDGRDEYMKLGEWERQNNFCIYTGKGFIKIPLPHELRVFHRLGDQIFHGVVGAKDWTEAFIDGILGFSDLIPIDPAGAIDASWAELMPDAVKPFAQMEANKNFMGSRIYNEWANPNTPGYLKARTNRKGDYYAPAFLVKMTEGLDNVTGGDGVEQGLVSLNPDVIEHFARGYFGGLYNLGMQSVDVASKVGEFTKTGELKLKVRDTPMKTFFASSDDIRLSSSAVNSKYFKISDEVKDVKRKVKGYEDQIDEYMDKVKSGEMSATEFAKKQTEINAKIDKQDEDKALDVYSIIQEINDWQKDFKELNEEEQKEAERIISELKEEAVNLWEGK